jgi:YjbE family integral membrane protein
VEILSMQFLSALFAIIIIDLVLAGDNAIVIALAARNLPAHLRTRAVVWGTGGAIFVRTLMTLVVVWLLKIPGLLLAGGLLLLWIAYKLLIDSSEGEEHHINSGANFWGAMKTIVIADAVMGLDNVLAVAGAAHGNFMLVVLGLLISIPIMIAGSQIILKYVQRFPSIVYIGAGVLVWTAAKMISHEPLVSDWFVAMGYFIWVYYLVVIGAILMIGHRQNSARKNPAPQIDTNQGQG